MGFLTARRSSLGFAALLLFPSLHAALKLFQLALEIEGLRDEVVGHNALSS